MRVHMPTRHLDLPADVDSAENATEPVASGIDPRISARRREVRRRSTRVRRWVAGSLLGMLVALLLGFLLLESPVFAARHVIIEGAKPAQSPQIKARAGLDSQPPLISLKPLKMAASVAGLPWVQQAKIQRRWPDTVVIVVSQRVAVASIRTAAKRGEFALVDKTGRVIGLSRSRPSGLPVLVGDVLVAPAGSWLGGHGGIGASVAASLPSSISSKVFNIWTTKTASVAMKMKSGPVVVLGSSQQLAAKVLALQTLIASVPMHNVKYINLTVPDVPTLTGG